MSNTKHTILFFQFSKNQTSRTYYDYDTVPEALTGICTIYENRLKSKNATSRRITYSVQDLFKWIDELHDFSGLILHVKEGVYYPQDRETLKRKLYNQLSKQAQ